MEPVSVSSSSQSNPLAQLGDARSGLSPVLVIGGGKSNVFLIVGLLAAAGLVWLIFRRK